MVRVCPVAASSVRRVERPVGRSCIVAWQVAESIGKSSRGSSKDIGDLGEGQRAERTGQGPEEAPVSAAQRNAICYALSSFLHQSRARQVFLSATAPLSSSVFLPLVGRF